MNGSRAAWRWLDVALRTGARKVEGRELIYATLHARMKDIQKREAKIGALDDG